MAAGGEQRSSEATPSVRSEASATTTGAHSLDRAPVRAGQITGSAATSAAKYEPSPGGALRQAQILSNVLYRRQTLRSVKTDRDAEIALVVHPLVLVMTQDCDLHQDFALRTTIPPEQLEEHEPKLLPNVLLCEIAPMSALLARTPKGKDIWKRIIQNNDDRYQVLEEIKADQDASGSGLPDLGIDFRRIFTIPTDELYVQLERGALRRAVLTSPFKEHLCNRFGHYLSRVALDQPHVVTPESGSA